MFIKWRKSQRQLHSVKGDKYRLSHFRAAVTLDIYVHLKDENNPDAADRLEKSVWAAEWQQLGRKRWDLDLKPI